MNNTIAIRKEQPKDYQEVFKINKAAFNQEGEALLVDALRKNKQAFIPELSLIAEIKGEIVGHILFTKIQIVNDNKEAFQSLALAPVAAKPGFQKIGIGSKLINSGFEIAKQLGYTSIIVLGHEQYYPKFGFLPAKKWDIKPPFEVPENVFMAIELVDGALQGVSGTVRYAREFEAV